jgi:hypothetical protein
MKALPPDTEIPKSNRRPSSGIFPKHVIARNQEAMARMTQPAL